MNFDQFAKRDPQPKPWAEGEKIPWNDPAFSARMLAEHLSQDHDAASRRTEKIDAHVRWIHERVLKHEPSRILDLGCGPGLYAQRLAQLGHTCTGIDFAPASIAYAREQAAQKELAISYQLADLRHADFGAGFDLVMLIFGEFNVFRPAEAAHILSRAHAALKPGGSILLEPHRFEMVSTLGHAPASWYASTGGLFDEGPHLCLRENFWDADQRVAIERYFVVREDGNVTCHSSSMQAYTNETYRALLAENGFCDPLFFSALGADETGPQQDLFALLSCKA